MARVRRGETRKEYGDSLWRGDFVHEVSKPKSPMKRTAFRLVPKYAIKPGEAQRKVGQRLLWADPLEVAAPSEPLEVCSSWSSVYWLSLFLEFVKYCLQVFACLLSAQLLPCLPGFSNLISILCTPSFESLMKTLMNIGHKSDPWEASPWLPCLLALLTTRQGWPLFSDRLCLLFKSFCPLFSFIHLFNHSFVNCARARDFPQFLANANSWIMLNKY